MSNIDFENLKECPSCVKLLGNTTDKELGIKTDAMFFTLSPDPDRNHFGDKLPEKQKKYIDKYFVECVAQCQKHMNIHGFSIHYEFNSSLNLHAHGIILIDQDKCGYDRWLSLVSKIFHKQLGRDFCKSTICMKTEWIKDYEKTMKYINKDNEYDPIHHLNKPKISLETILDNDKIQ